ncbi:MAG: heat-inducible transcription repressor HrcA [Deltaproteobacteria bacterium]|nr:heat-inducible transcription repressor HrcA [Deltaproteobacteria bacterium]
MEQLGERDQKVLGAIVEEFVQTAEPVGSRYLMKKRRFAFSPATIRNVMADLEDLGYLAQPHTSAGRQPTDKGYRYYVDHLMAAEPPLVQDRRRIRRQMSALEHPDVDGLLDSASRVLSATAHQLGVVIAPRFETSVFRRIEFVLLREGRVLVILVSQSGVVHHRPVEAAEIGSQDELDQMANYLNSLLQDLPLQAVKEKILAEMATEKALYDSLLQRALKLGNRILEDAPTTDGVFLGDPSTLLGHPEFANATKMRSIFEAFEKKGLLLRLLERASRASGIQVLIGQENALTDLSDCAVVSASYGKPGRAQGSLGVIGPTRMDYARVMGLVDFTARLLGELLEAL